MASLVTDTRQRQVLPVANNGKVGIPNGKICQSCEFWKELWEETTDTITTTEQKLAEVRLKKDYYEMKLNKLNELISGMNVSKAWDIDTLSFFKEALMHELIGGFRSKKGRLKSMKEQMYGKMPAVQEIQEQLKQAPFID